MEAHKIVRIRLSADLKIIQKITFNLNQKTRRKECSLKTKGCQLVKIYRLNLSDIDKWC